MQSGIFPDGDWKLFWIIQDFKLSDVKLESFYYIVSSMNG
jgi:hypothetical protein